MDPEVQIFGKTILHECRSILHNRIPEIAVTCFMDSLKGDYILIHGDEICCIFESSQHPVIEMARKKQYNTLSCGFSAYDTLVLSSSSEEQAVISLQREIRTLSSRLLEPGDFLIRKSQDYSDTTVLLCTGVLLLLDQNKSVFEF